MTPASKHYPLLIVDVLRYLEVTDTDQNKGGKILVFLDEGGGQVTFRLAHTVADNLRKMLEAGAIPPPPGTH